MHDSYVLNSAHESIAETGDIIRKAIIKSNTIILEELIYIFDKVFFLSLWIIIRLLISRQKNN